MKKAELEPKKRLAILFHLANQSQLVRSKNPLLLMLQITLFDGQCFQNLIPRQERFEIWHNKMQIPSLRERNLRDTSSKSRYHFSRSLIKAWESEDETEADQFIFLCSRRRILYLTFAFVMRKYETNLVALYAKAMIAIVNTEIPYRSAKGGKKVKSTPIVEGTKCGWTHIEKSFAPSTNASVGVIGFCRV